MTSPIGTWKTMLMRLAPVACGTLLMLGGGPASAAPVTGGCVQEVAGFADVPGCGSSDVALTDIVPGSVVILDDGCTSASDTVTFTAQGMFVLNANSERFDIGVYISTDGDPDGNGAKTGACARDNIPVAPDPPYVSLDADACGDLDDDHSPLTQPVTSPIGPFTIQCRDADDDGKVDIFHCETWNTAGQNTVCSSAADIKAGAPAKCNCGTLPGACIAASDDNPCTADVCQGTCSNNPQQTCEVSADCGSGTCQNIQPANVPVQAGTPCGDPSDGVCDDPDSCDANALCLANYASAGVACRPAAGVCDTAETCTGSSASCPMDAKSAALCRPAAGVCDLGESCDGASDDCPADAKSTAECRGSAGVCDLAESCDGSADDCPADAKSTAACRGSAGVCDLTESCDGSNNDCPADAKGTAECRASAGICDLAESCDGAGDDCPADAKSTAECRGSGGACDLAESCDGAGDDCPADAKSAAECRGSAGVCDPAESCDGATDTCPADAKSTAECRTSAGVCDQAESCDGAGDDCPADAKSTAQCRGAAGACDVAEDCDGESDECPADAKQPSGTECRAASQVCDAAETCDGSLDACPTDADQPDGTPCPDALYCNGEETCQSGVCVDRTNPCVFVCSEESATCLPDACPSGPQVGCRTASKSVLVIKNKAIDARDKLIWKFLRGQSTTFADLSDPKTAASYTLCIYEAANTLVTTVNIAPDGTKWSVLGRNKGYKYKDLTGASDGVQKAVFKASGANKTKQKIKGKGVNLPDILGPSGLAMPVTVQLLNHEVGECWQSSFTGVPKKNTASLFKAKQ